jgi:hypothetical protein
LLGFTLFDQIVTTGYRANGFLGLALDVLYDAFDAFLKPIIVLSHGISSFIVKAIPCRSGPDPLPLHSRKDVRTKRVGDQTPDNVSQNTKGMMVW